MHIDEPQPGVTRIRYRPVFVPAFCLMFVAIGLWQLATTTWTEGWDGNHAFGIAVSILLGGGCFLVTGRRDTYWVDVPQGRFWWAHKGYVRTRSGSFPIDEIESVLVHRGPEPDSTTWRVSLRLANGKNFGLGTGFTSDEGAHRRVGAAIDSSLRASRPA